MGPVSKLLVIVLGVALIWGCSTLRKEEPPVQDPVFNRVCEILDVGCEFSPPEVVREVIDNPMLDGIFFPGTDSITVSAVSTTPKRTTMHEMVHYVVDNSPEFRQMSVCQGEDLARIVVALEFEDIYSRDWMSLYPACTDVSLPEL